MLGGSISILYCKRERERETRASRRGFIHRLKNAFVYYVLLAYPWEQREVISQAVVAVLPKLKTTYDASVSAYPTFPAGEPASIIGWGRFHFSVRNGKRWSTSAQNTDAQESYVVP